MLDGLKHEVGRTGTWLTGKGVVSIFNRVLNALTGLGKWVAAVAIPLGTGMSAVLAQMDHKHELRRLTNFYRREIGAKLGKDPGTVDIGDMKKVALGDADHGIEPNPTLGEMLVRSTRHRWLKIGVSLLAGIAAAVTVLYLAPALGIWAAGAGAGSALAPVAAFLGGHALGPAILAGMTGFITGQVFGTVAENAAGIHAPSAHAAIAQLRQGKMFGEAIAPEQVMGVYIAAHPALAASIKGEYGKDYSRLPSSAQQEIARRYDGAYNISQMTADLNNRQVKVKELAFAVHGQHSGVPRLEEPPLSGLQRAQLRAAQALQMARARMAEASIVGREKIGYALDYGRGRSREAWDYCSEKFSTAMDRAKCMLARSEAAKQEALQEAQLSGEVIATETANPELSPRIRKILENGSKAGELPFVDGLAQREASPLRGI